jgi:hypothetical protein
VARSIYQKIASVPEIRGAGIICNNYPHLDDTLASYRKRSSDPHSLGWLSGDWVDGGCWATVEGRAILAYMKLGQYADALRAAEVYMNWAEEYRQDAPLSQWGHNVNNPWQRENAEHTACDYPVSVMIDNFAPITCLLRGLFDYEADANGLWIKPSIPADITAIAQKEPVFFGGCRIFLEFADRDMAGDSTVLTADARGRIFIPSECLPRGGVMKLTVNRDGLASLSPTEIRTTTELTGEVDGLPEAFTEIYNTCKAMLADAVDVMEISRIREIMLAVEAAALRRRLPFDRHVLRPMTDDKMAKIVDMYDKTVEELYKGLKNGRPSIS